MYLVRKTVLRQLRQHRFTVRCMRLSDDATAKNPASQQSPIPVTVPTENPITRSLQLLRQDMNKIRHFFLPPTADEKTSKPPADENLTLRQMADHQSSATEFQSHCDVLIIGGGGVGSSIAYWLKKRAFSGLNVVVLEKDPTVSVCSTGLLEHGLNIRCQLPCFSINAPPHRCPSAAFASSSRSKRTFSCPCTAPTLCVMSTSTWTPTCS